MPALLNTFLFIEPDDNYLDYASTVLHQIIQANKQAGQSITELMGTDANPDRIKQEISKSSPLTVAGAGHGNESVYTVENLVELLNASNPAELALMKERVLDLCSCLTAVALGPALIAAGAVAYSGYNTEFWFYTSDPAGTTRDVQTPFLAEFQYVASLLQGKTTGVARQEQLNRYDEEIAYWTTGAGKDDPAAPELINILQMNKAASIFLGQSAVSPSPTAGVLGLHINPVVTFAIASIPMAYFIYKTAIAK